MAEQAAAPTRRLLPDDLRLRRNRSIALVIGFLVFVLDQATKWVVKYPLNLEGQPDHLITLTSFFNLRWVENTGVSLGLLTADSNLARWLLVGMTTVIAILALPWASSSAARSATSSTDRGSAMSSTSPTCTSANGGPFSSSTSAMVQLPSACCFCLSARC